MGAHRGLRPAGDRPASGLRLTGERGLATLLLLSLFAACPGEETGPPAATAPVVPLGVARTSPASGFPSEATWSVRFDLRRDEYLYVRIDQSEADLHAWLLGPDGELLLAIDGLTGPGEPEQVHWVATAAGEYVVELSPVVDPEGAGPVHEVARRPASEADRRRTRAESALARGHELRRSGDPKACREAAELYRRAAELFAGLALPPRQAEAWFGLGLLSSRCLHEPELARESFLQAAELFDDERAQGDARHLAAELAAAAGDLDAAAGQYEEALRLRQRSGDRFGEALSANNLGHVLHQLGRYDEARSRFETAIERWAELGETGELANTLHNLGQLQRELGEREQARSSLERARRLWHGIGNAAGEAMALTALGILDLEQRRPDAARVHLEASLPLRSGDSRGRAITLTTLGVAYRELERYQASRRVYREALRFFRHQGDLREQARCLHNLGWLDWYLGLEGEALDRFLQASTLFERVRDPPAQADALRGAAQVLRSRGNFTGALRCMERALQEIEALRSRQMTSATRSAFFATRQDHYDFLVDLLMEMHRREPARDWEERALEVNERARARSLLDSLVAAGVDLPRGQAPGLLSRQRELERRIEIAAGHQARLASDPQATPGQRRRTATELARLWNEHDRLLTRMRATGDAGFGDRQDPSRPRPLTASEIRRQVVDQETLLLEYRLGEDRSFVWAVTPDAVDGFVLPFGRDAIEQAVRDVVQVLPRSYARTAEIALGLRLAELSRMLLTPVARRLADHRLVIVVDGALQYLPFAALPEPGGGEPLLAGHEIVTLPSASVLSRLRARDVERPPAPRLLWVLADPKLDADLPPLPYSREEAEAILQLVPAEERLAALGVEANRAAVVSGRIGAYRLLHFVTHGVFDASDPRGSRLVLSRPDGSGSADGFLYPADVYRLDLAADLVVLSACRTAMGKQIRGEGLVGLTQAFLHAGATRVVVSQFGADDRVTAELMERFYRALLDDGQSPAAALRAAQESIRREPAWRAPYYWAGFQIQGEWRGLRSLPRPRPRSARRSLPR